MGSSLEPATADEILGLQTHDDNKKKVTISPLLCTIFLIGWPWLLREKRGQKVSAPSRNFCLWPNRSLPHLFKVCKVDVPSHTVGMKKGSLYLFCWFYCLIQQPFHACFALHQLRSQCNTHLDRIFLSRENWNELEFLVNISHLYIENVLKG